MDNAEKLRKIILKVADQKKQEADKESKRESVRAKYKEKKKIKKLTTDERLSRIEELLGLEEA